ncbi:MAG TPA: DUF2892 domain-containing protein [Anaeromyxobacteraceae bacterium]|nr:DUF2892 domain-containing protein [Anaeromyxobacteraceae bacterium]
MTWNGTASRVIRVLVGASLLSLTMVGPHTPWGFIGLAPLLSGLAGFCPICSIPGVRGCKLPAS